MKKLAALLALLVLLPVTLPMQAFATVGEGTPAGTVTGTYSTHTRVGDQLVTENFAVVQGPDGTFVISIGGSVTK